MADEWLTMVEEDEPAGPRIGSWIGAAICALGISACLTINVMGSMRIMDQGGFVASGGPYEIAHPVPSGFWILPLAFVGLFAFSIAHAVFASRIKAPQLMYATWCALWTAVGATTFWYGLHPPHGNGLAWGWLIMGGIFLLVGLGSIAAYFAMQGFIELSHSEMSAGRLVVYWTITAAAVLVGVPLGIAALAAV
jgi:hypothetical protein